MNIDPEVLKISQKVKQRMVELRHPPLCELDSLTADEGRYFFHEGNKLYQMKLEDDIEFEDRHIERSHHPSLAIRIYRPVVQKRKLLPILVYLQGGGWVFGTLDSADDTCSFLAKYAECIVISVDYRHAPEHKYPLPIIDAINATKWVYKNASNLGAIAIV